MTHALALGLDRTVLELKMYFREKESVVFSFAFPVVMLALFALVLEKNFSGSADDGGLNAAAFFLPGMIAAGIVLTSFQTIALSVTTERDDGTLKRLRGTPMPSAPYFLGKAGLVLVTSLAQNALLLFLARVCFGVPLPADFTHWGRFVTTYVLGVVGGTVLGVAYSSLLPSARSAGAIVIAPVLVLQFVSGVYFAFRDLPGWIQQVAALFPLKWVAQGMRSAFYPDTMARFEMAQSWESGRTVLVLAAWALGGLAVGVRIFRWVRRDG